MTREELVEKTESISERIYKLATESYTEQAVVDSIMQEVSSYGY